MSDTQSELSTFWQIVQLRSQWHYDLPRLEAARKSGIPIIQAVFDRIPDHEKFIPYYLYLCKWPNAKTMYRASHRARSLHRRTVLDGLIRYANNRHSCVPLLELWGPLIEFDPNPVFDEAICMIRNCMHFCLNRERCQHIFFSLTVLQSPAYTEWVMNAENVRNLETYINEFVVPFTLSDETEQVIQRKKEHILDVWHNGIKPELENQRLQVYEKATQRLCVYKEELLARAWEYPRYIVNCLDESDTRELKQRWNI
jgi:hypothetical protein